VWPIFWRSFKVLSNAIDIFHQNGQLLASLPLMMMGQSGLWYATTGAFAWPILEEVIHIQSRAVEFSLDGQLPCL
jgi:hypothetical protein